MTPASITTFGRKICLVETRDFGDLVSELANSSCHSVFFCNVHMLMLSQEDKVLANAMDSADCVFSDSAPVAWLQRRISGKNAKVIPGYKIMLAVCERAAKNGENVGFFGSTPNVMKQLVRNLTERFEGLRVTYQYCPPIMRGELISTQEELQTLNSSGVKWLFVGLGCPKQEKWIYRYNSELQCNVLGIGAAFDWFSGLTSKPPIWMEKYGLAWIYRLFQDPFRMSHRYMKYNTKFILKTFKFYISG